MSDYGVRTDIGEERSPGPRLGQPGTRAAGRTTDAADGSPCQPNAVPDMTPAALAVDCVFDAEQLTPLLATLRARVTGDRAGFYGHAAALRTATTRNPFDAYVHAATAATVVGRQLLAEFSIDDMIAEAMELADFDDQDIPNQLVAPALTPTAALILGKNVDPAEVLGDDPISFAVAALANQVIAAGLILLLAEWEDVVSGDVMDRVEAEMVAMTPESR